MVLNSDNTIFFISLFSFSSSWEVSFAVTPLFSGLKESFGRRKEDAMRREVAAHFRMSVKDFFFFLISAFFSRLCNTRIFFILSIFVTMFRTLRFYSNIQKNVYTCSTRAYWGNFRHFMCSIEKLFSKDLMRRKMKKSSYSHVFWTGFNRFNMRNKIGNVTASSCKWTFQSSTLCLNHRFALRKDDSPSKAIAFDNEVHLKFFEKIVGGYDIFLAFSPEKANCSALEMCSINT